MIQKDLCTSVFIAALFTIARARKQRKCPTTEEWMKTTWYNGISATKKNEIMPFATTWVDLEIIIGREEVRQEKTNTA